MSAIEALEKTYREQYRRREISLSVLNTYLVYTDNEKKTLNSAYYLDKNTAEIVLEGKLFDIAGMYNDLNFAIL